MLSDYIKDVRYDIFVMYSGIFMMGGIVWIYSYFNMDNLKVFINSQVFLIANRKKSHYLVSYHQEQFEDDIHFFLYTLNNQDILFEITY